jgi:hypothetical protein
MSHEASNVRFLRPHVQTRWCDRCGAITNDPGRDPRHEQRITLEDDTTLMTLLLCADCAEELSDWLWKERPCA